MLQNTNRASKRIDHQQVLDRVFSHPFPDLKNIKAHQIRLLLNRVTMKLKRERSRGELRHYRYDINKHIALAIARTELLARLKQMEGQ